MCPPSIGGHARGSRSMSRTASKRSFQTDLRESFIRKGGNDSSLPSGEFKDPKLIYRRYKYKSSLYRREAEATLRIEAIEARPPRSAENAGSADAFIFSPPVISHNLSVIVGFSYHRPKGTMKGTRNRRPDEVLTLPSTRGCHEPRTCRVAFSGCSFHSHPVRRDGLSCTLARRAPSAA